MSERLSEREREWHRVSVSSQFARQVEVMACPKGCTNGGGQVRKQALESVNRNFDEWFGGESAEEVTPRP